jgi:phage terminase small subunit
MATKNSGAKDGMAKARAARAPKNTLPELTQKQAIFIEEYLIDLNGAQAAIRAGYSPNTAKEQAFDLLTRPHIKAALSKAMEARVSRTKITADRVLEEIGRIAFFDPRRMYKPDGNLKAVVELDDDTAAVVAGLEATEEFEGSGDSRKVSGMTKKVRLADKVAALTLAARHLGMLNDKLEVIPGVIVKDYTGKGSASNG